MFISEQLGKSPQDESHFNILLVNYFFDYFIKIKIISNTQYELLFCTHIKKVCVLLCNG